LAETEYPALTSSRLMKKPSNKKRRRRSIIAFEMIRLDENPGNHCPNNSTAKFAMS